MKNVPPPGKVFRPEILSGWKDIAAYLGKGVRTVQRYERELTLPVRRPARKSAASVIATKAELDGWIAAAPLRKVFQLSPDSARKSGIDTRGALDELKRQVAQNCAQPCTSPSCRCNRIFVPASPKNLQNAATRQRD